MSTEHKATKLTFDSACRAILCGSDGNEPEWNPYDLGPRSNQLLLWFYELLCSAGLRAEMAYSITERAELGVVAVLYVGRAFKRRRKLIKIIFRRSESGVTYE